MLGSSIRMPKGAFGYARYKSWAAEAKGIRIPNDGIRMPKIAFGCPRGAFGYTEQAIETEGIRMLKRASRCTLRLSEYWKRVSGCLQLKKYEQQRTNTKIQN